MKAELLISERRMITDEAFAELKIWKVPAPVRGSQHGFKYSLAYVVSGECVLRYDNEAGKGDHRHVNGIETPYPFESIDRLVDDFFADVANWRP